MGTRRPRQPERDRQRIDVDPLLSRAAQAVFSYVAFAEAADDPARRRMVVRGRSSAIEALDASFPVQIWRTSWVSTTGWRS